MKLFNFIFNIDHSYQCHLICVPLWWIYTINNQLFWKRFLNQFAVMVPARRTHLSTNCYSTSPYPPTPYLRWAHPHRTLWSPPIANDTPCGSLSSLLLYPSCLNFLPGQLTTAPYRRNSSRWCSSPAPPKSRKLFSTDQKIINNPHPTPAGFVILAYLLGILLLQLRMNLFRQTPQFKVQGIEHEESTRSKNSAPKKL